MDTPFNTGGENGNNIEGMNIRYSFEDKYNKACASCV